VVPFGNKIILKNFVPQPPPLLTYAKRFLFHSRRGSMLKENIKTFLNSLK